MSFASLKRAGGAIFRPCAAGVFLLLVGHQTRADTVSFYDVVCVEDSVKQSEITRCRNTPAVTGWHADCIREVLQGCLRRHDVVTPAEMKSEAERLQATQTEQIARWLQTLEDTGVMLGADK